MRVSPYAKTVVAAVASLLLTANDLLTDDVWSSNDTVKLVGAIVATVCVWAVPNRTTQTP